MKWIGPLFKNAGGWEAFVAYENGKWFLDKDSPVEIGAGKSGVMLLPLLQKGYGEDYETQIGILQNGLVENGMEPNLAFKFPFLVPVLTAYKCMPNWCESAVSWLKHIELSQQGALEIFDSCHNQAMNQKVRQDTIKYINEWSKERGFQFAKYKC